MIDGPELGPSNDRVALKTLTLAQSFLRGEDWPDLASLDRCHAQEDSFLIGLPIGAGYVAPLEVGLHHQSAKAMRLEAELLAGAVADHLKRSAATIRRLETTRRVAQALASAALDHGARFTVGRATLEPQTSAWGGAMGRIEIELGYLNFDLRQGSSSILAGNLRQLRDTIERLTPLVALRTRMDEVLRRLGAAAFFEPVTLAAIRSFGLEPRAVLERLQENPYSGQGMNVAEFNPKWRRAQVTAWFELGLGVSWTSGELIVRPPLPDAVVVGMVGRRLCEVVAHPVLEEARIASGENQTWNTAIGIEQLPPWALLGDRSVHPLPEPERAEVLAILSDWQAWFEETGNHS